LDTGFCAELQEPVSLMRREKHKRPKPRGESTEAGNWGGSPCNSDEGLVMRLERRGRVRWSCLEKQLVTG
jgi:hypothetical protein